MQIKAKFQKGQQVFICWRNGHVRFYGPVTILEVRTPERVETIKEGEEWDFQPVYKTGPSSVWEKQVFATREEGLQELSRLLEEKPS
jgi:hypothetical protein